ncbi:unnamed protein product [Heligmosomoides polygyrus]|uniref:Reverse transcriptase domain-containing protein n=1 Tax=Heligmosomoides polygyrus TaxID=6339 RepID=A0A183FUT9_HELPZ|nr:unnamed protein product [Heligmosomoides polygyrus]
MKVLDEFRNTVQKKDDGYYARLPWKEIPVALPDNRAIADVVEGTIHYLAHQAVLTPHKNTTKTFGLLPSPFLLVATTYYHLDQYPNDVELVKGIKDNVYVDNLLVTTDTPEDGLRVYSTTKEIFNELKMNLREFASNDRAVVETIPAADRSTEEDPKVLGIKWNRSEDQFQVACTMLSQEVATKRIDRTAFEDLIPNDEGHHWILGNVLHKELRIQQLEDNGRRLTGLQQGRRTTPTRAGVTTSRLL